MSTATTTAEQEVADPKAQERAELIAGLHEVANALQLNPDMPAPPFVVVHVYGWDLPGKASDVTAQLAKAVKAVPGRIEKGGSEEWLKLSRAFGPRVTYGIECFRDRVCTRKVVGTRTVEKMVETTPAVTTTEEVDEDIVEWDCEPLLGRDDDA